MSIDRVFGALSHPTRRAILTQLEHRGDASVSELARTAATKLPTMLKHLDVLDDAGLITRHKIGRTVTVHLAARRLQPAWRWLARYERFWAPRLDRLVARAEHDERIEKAAGR